MGYSTEEDIVRVDFFKPSGKWYTTEAIEWTGNYTGDIHKAFRQSVWDAVGAGYADLTAVCLEPYHENAHPLMIRNWEP